MFRNCIFFSQQHRVISPCQALFTNNPGQFFQCLNAFFYGRNSRLYIFSVRSDCIIKIRIKFIGYFYNIFQYSFSGVNSYLVTFCGNIGFLDNTYPSSNLFNNHGAKYCTVSVLTPVFKIIFTPLFYIF